MKEVLHFAKGILSGEGAVVASSIINTEVNNRFGLWFAAGVSAPIVEELTKTMIAEGFNGDVLMSHVAFGAHEGFMYSKGKTQANAFDHRRPLLHASFGVLYLMGRRFGGSKAAGLLTAMMGHFLWNQFALLGIDWDSIEKPVESRDEAAVVTMAVTTTAPTATIDTLERGLPKRRRKMTFADVKREVLI